MVIKTGKFGTPQKEYIGTNGITVIVELGGRNAGKVITAFRVIALVSDVCSRMFGPFDEEQLRRRQPVYRRVAQRILEAQQP